jgi:hypothetical protein
MNGFCSRHNGVDALYQVYMGLEIKERRIFVLDAPLEPIRYDTNT